MAGAFDFAGESALAARTIAGLTARFNFAAFADVTREGVQVFVIKASAFGAVSAFTALAPPSSPAPATAAMNSAAPAATAAPRWS